MMNETGLRRSLPDQLSGSGHTFGTPRHPSITNPILSKRVCFYKSGDPQFSGLHMVINNRTFKTFDALLDNLSKKVPLPFGVRNIATPQGVHAICNLDELEDGKSYICSDSRKVKPINLAVARKKPPPWYHARPVSSRRRTVQKARFFPGHSIHRQEPVVVRTPKKLLVFRNGDPSVKRSVVLQRRTTPTFESILGYISEVMQFPVVKLHTPEGRRVDGLPGLILCSGTVVAAGRERFRPGNYNVQKSAAPTRLPSNQKGGRRLKAGNRKNKAASYTSKPRIFSPSSERYIVSRIHNSIAESLCDLPSNPTNSIEFDSSRILDSVAETEEDTCLGDGAEGQDCLLPNDDDIEKSFRVNQDGSMTVEMKVRLTIKEEETVHWTTTVTRSSVANQLNFLPDPEPEEEICSSESNPLDLQTPSTAVEITKNDKMKDDNDEDPLSLSNGALSESSFEEDNIKVHTDAMSLQRTPTPGQKQIRKKQASVESIKSVTADGIQEGMVGSYSYREQMENGAMTEQYCMVKQSSTRPVPKPRRLGSVDANSRQVSTFKSAEILQIESSEEEVTETVLHIYEHQTCQDNFLANYCAQGMSASAITFCRPATSDTGHLSSSSDFEPEPWRPSTASESISIWRAESMSLTSDLTLPSQNTGAIPATKAQRQSQKPTKGKDNPKQREANKGKGVSPTANETNKHVMNSAQATEKRKKGKTFSSAGFIKRIYGKSSKTMTKLKKRQTKNKDGGVTTKSLQLSDDTIIKDPNIPPPLEENVKKAVSHEKSRLSVSPPEVSQLKGTLTRQTSMHQEKKSQNDSSDVSESMSLPAFNSSSSVTNEYVAEWLEKAHIKPTVYAEEESKPEAVESESGRSENELSLMNVAQEEKCLKETSKMQTVNTKPLPENVLASSVKQRIKSFENKSSDPSVEKAAVTQKIVHRTNQTITTDAEHSLAQKNTDEIKPLSNGSRYEMNPLTTNISTEIPSDIEVESKSRPIKIQFQKATPLNTLSMELPPPPPPENLLELSVAEEGGMDVSSAASSPLYRVSSVSSHMSDIQPISVTPTSDNRAISLTDHTMEMTTSIETDNLSTLREAPLPRVPSIKRAALVSNLSLERKMSLRKACVDKYTLCSDATSSIPTNIVVDNVLPNGICLTETQQPPEETQQPSSALDLMSSQSCCTSASPASLTSEERESSASILSSEAPTPSSLSKETNAIKTSTQMEASAPKPLVKKVKLINSPSPERKPRTMKLSSEVPNASPKLFVLHNHPPDKTMSPNIGKRKSATPPPSPASERQQKLYKSKQQKRSPYSQSLDMVSPPVRQKSNRLSSEKASEETKQTQRKPSPQRTPRQTPQPTSAETKTTDNLTKAGQTKSITDKIIPQPLNISNQPNTKLVLEEICSSIKSIRQMTQNKRRSCLETSNSLPDFSSHVASTFGSSSKALLAFLSVMSLKHDIPNLDVDGLNASDVSSAEALKIIDSLREIASVEDSHKLKNSLSNLEQSASKQLLQSWKGFQQFSDKSKSCRSTPNYAEQGLLSKVSPQKDTEEDLIDEIMDNLDIPEILREELASLSVERDNEQSKSVSMTKKEESMSNQCHFSSDEDKANVDVGSIIKKTADINQPKLVSSKANPEEGQDMSSANKVVEQKQNAPSVEAGEHVSKEGELSDPESGSKQEEKLRTDYYVELSVSRNESRSCPDSESNLVSEVGCKELSNKDVLSYLERPSNSDTKHTQTGCMGLEVKVDESTSDSDVDEAPSSEGEQQDAEPKRLKVIVEESLSDAEKEQDVESKQLKVTVEKSLSDAEKEQQDVESKRLKVILEESLSDAEKEEESMEEEEEHVLNTIEEEDQEELIKCTEGVEDTKDEVNSEDENSHTKQKSLSNLIENHTETYSFDAEEDSGNDHSSCDDHAGTEQPKTEEQFSSSTELSYNEKELSSEEEHVITDRQERRKESCTEYEQANLSEVRKSEKVAEKLKHHCEEMISQSVAERVSLLEKQVANSTKRNSDTKSCAHFVSDVEDSSSESPSSQSALCTRSAPQSSLSFSYDSSSVITTQPEGNKVRSIREMFLAKSATDIQQGQTRYPSPKTSDVSDLRAETSVSGGYQSQTSSELSSGEDDSSRKSITKGFVRRTIERLYGKKDSHSDVDERSEKPPSAPKQKKKEPTSIFSPFHTARCKAMSELSYFNSTNALDTLSEATRCLAFNAQVGPGESLPNNEGRWLLKENTLIRKSVSDPVGINKTYSNSPKEELCDDTEDDSPYSLFSTKSDLEDKKKSLSRKCTYFSLPHGSDSDACQDDLSNVSKSSANRDTLAETKDNSEDTKTWAERNGTLPGVVVSDFKITDNKVHPLVEVPPDGEVVVAQPVKNQGVVTRRPEPDMLDFLYNFCGEHCPIL